MLTASNGRQSTDEIFGRFRRLKQVENERRLFARRTALGKILRNFAETDFPAVRQHDVTGRDIVPHTAIKQRTASERVGRRHAADRRLQRCADLDRKPHALRLERLVKGGRRDPRLDNAGLCGGVIIKKPREIFRSIDDEARADCLTRAAGAPASRDNRHARLPGHLHGRENVVLRFRQGDCDGEALKRGAIRGVPAAAEFVRKDIALHGVAQMAGKRCARPW